MSEFNNNTISIKELMGKSFLVEKYQRGYKWGIQQVQELLTDIYDFDRGGIESFYCLQPLVIKTLTENEYELIDGQQRLTTMTLLYLALYRFALDNDMEEKAAEINETILINRFVKEDSSKLKLKQTDVNAKAFRYLMNENKPSDYNEYSRIIDNYNHFFNEIGRAHV